MSPAIQTSDIRPWKYNPPHAFTAWYPDLMLDLYIPLYKVFLSDSKHVRCFLVGRTGKDNSSVNKTSADRVNAHD